MGLPVAVNKTRKASWSKLESLNHQSVSSKWLHGICIVTKSSNNHISAYFEILVNVVNVILWSVRYKNTHNFLAKSSQYYRYRFIDIKSFSYFRFLVPARIEMPARFVNIPIKDECQYLKFLDEHDISCFKISSSTEIPDRWEMKNATKFCIPVGRYWTKVHYSSQNQLIILMD